MSQKELLTVPEVMRRLKVSRRTVYYWIDKGILNPTKIGSVYRFDKEQIDQLVVRETGNTAMAGDGLNSAVLKPRKRILVVDDDLLVRESLKMILEREGYDVRVVSGGQSAVDFVTQEDFDLILTDFKMPQMDGVDTIQALRTILQQQGKKAIPEIILTAYDDEELKERAASIGVEQVIQKPFELERFLGILKEHLQSL